MTSRQTTTARKRKRLGSSEPPKKKISKIEFAPYEYEPLDKDQHQIRLFKLFPGQANNELCGTLTTADPRRRPVYDAVSYVWGDATPCSHVRINDQRLPVARNLHKALVALRLAHEPRVLWIDAICINQDDIHERGHQVQLMRSVFTNARVVRVWLDIDIDLESPAIHAARRLPEVHRPGQGLPFRSSRDHTRQQQSIKLRDRPIEFWAPLYQIFSDPYWERVWTQQELFLSNDLLFHFPRGTLDPQPIFLFDDAVVYSHIALSYDSPLSTSRGYGTRIFGRALFSSLADGFWAVRGQGSIRYGDYNGVFLLNLFLRSRNLRCKDPRDRVFGLIGLARDCHARPVLADYTLTLWQTHCMVIQHFISSTQSLNFLCQQYLFHVRESCYSHKGTHHVGATWLPTPEKGCYLIYDWLRTRGATGDVLFSDDGGTNYEEGVLSVRGVKYDTIEAATTPNLYLEPLSSWRIYLEAFYASTRSRSQSSQNNVWSDTSLFGIFDRWQTNNRYPNLFGEPNPTQKQLSENIVDFLDFFQTNVSNNMTFGQISTELSLDPRANGETPGINKVRLRTSRTLRFCIAGGGFFVTQNDQMGLAYSCCQDCQPEPNDEVWVLFGCAMPMVLRPQATPAGERPRFSVIGPAVIDGLMEGEAVQGIEQDGTCGPGYSGDEPRGIHLV